MNKEPVYPKTDPEYRKRVLEELYKRVRNSRNFYDETEYQGKPRGRKPQFKERPKARPRIGERYDWLD